MRVEHWCQPDLFNMFFFSFHSQHLLHWRVLIRVKPCMGPKYYHSTNHKGFTAKWSECEFWMWPYKREKNNWTPSFVWSSFLFLFLISMAWLLVPYSHWIHPWLIHRTSRTFHKRLLPHQSPIQARPPSSSTLQPWQGTRQPSRYCTLSPPLPLALPPLACLDSWSRSWKTSPSPPIFFFVGLLPRFQWNPTSHCCCCYCCCCTVLWLLPPISGRPWQEGRLRERKKKKSFPAILIFFFFSKKKNKNNCNHYHLDHVTWKITTFHVTWPRAKRKKRKRKKKKKDQDF